MLNKLNGEIDIMIEHGAVNAGGNGAATAGSGSGAAEE